MKAQDAIRAWKAKDRNHTAQRLADDLAVTASQVSRWMSGEHIPHLRFRREISAIIGAEVTLADDWKLLPAASPPLAATDGGDIAQGFDAQGVPQG